MFPLGHQDAEALAHQGVSETSQGFYWSYDPKLIAGSELRLSSQQVDAFRSRVTARTQVVLAEGGLTTQEHTISDWLSASPHWSLVWLPGHHHLHMHTQCAQVASTINTLFKSRDDE